MELETGTSSVHVTLPDKTQLLPMRILQVMRQHTLSVHVIGSEGFRSYVRQQENKDILRSESMDTRNCSKHIWIA